MVARIGIVGWCTHTGLGYMNHDMWLLKFADAWLVPPHPVVGIADSLLPADAVVCGDSPQRDVAKFLDSVDIVVFCERPTVRDVDLIQEAQSRNVLTCCVPMMEWLPPVTTAWVRQVDAMWAPTAIAKSALQRKSQSSVMARKGIRWSSRINGGTWGVNLSRFPFIQRHKCERYLFCNGMGGSHARKGLHAVLETARTAPDLQFLIRSQVPIEELPPNCELLSGEVAAPYELYTEGDIMLAPSRFEGLGLQLYESQASGLPVITTAAAPMNECRPLDVLSYRQRLITLHTWRVPAYDVDIPHMVRVLRLYQGVDLTELSLTARSEMLQHFDLSMTLAEMRTWLESLLVKKQMEPQPSTKRVTRVINHPSRWMRQPKP